MKLRELYRQKIEKRRRALEELSSFFKKIKKAAKSFDKNAEVYLFGSFLKRKKFTASSDIDILVLIKDLEHSERAKVLTGIKRAIDFNPLFQIHLVNESEYRWYKRFVKSFKKI